MDIENKSMINAGLADVNKIDSEIAKFNNLETDTTVIGREENGKQISEIRTFLTDPNYKSNYKDLTKCSLLDLVVTYMTIKSMTNKNFTNNYKMVVRYIKLLDKIAGKPTMPDQVNDVFWQMFIKFLTMHKLCPSSIKLVCVELRTVLAWAGKHGVKLDINFDDFKLPNYYREQIALTPAEVARIYYFNLHILGRRKQFIEHLERVRDMFVLSCNLGQRWSDMIRLDPSWFKGDQITVFQKKTGNIVKFNISDYCLDKQITYEILERYNYTAPCKANLSNYDRYLKFISVQLGGTFDRIVKREEKFNSQIVSETTPRWKAMASHVARRTCATYNWHKYDRKEDVMKMTGHKTEAALKHYIIADID